MKYKEGYLCNWCFEYYYKPKEVVKLITFLDHKRILHFCNKKCFNEFKDKNLKRKGELKNA